jgi:hypothetical protein
LNLQKTGAAKRSRQLLLMSIGSFNTVMKKYAEKTSISQSCLTFFVLSSCKTMTAIMFINNNVLKRIENNKGILDGYMYQGAFFCFESRNL